VTSPLLSRPGAVAGLRVDAGVAWHYGDPLREQRVAVESGAVVDRSHRGVLRIGGPERLSWLHSLTSQHLLALAPGEWTQALVLSPHGHVEHHLVLTDDGAATWIHVEPGTAAALAAYLESMKFWADVVVEDVTSSYGVLSTIGGGDLVVPRESLVAAVDGSGVPLVGHGAWEALRVAAGVPRLGFETDHRTIPHEIGWLRSAVHLDKGCYRGQETVARVHNLGKPPRMLVLLHLDGSGDRPTTGDPVLAGGRAVGRLGTVVEHVDLGPVALALLKRAIPADTALSTGGDANVAAMIDAGSLPAADGPGAGRVAVERLRGTAR
jgi:folate-binding protein YgfZ